MVLLVASLSAPGTAAATGASPSGFLDLWDDMSERCRAMLRTGDMPDTDGLKPVGRQVVDFSEPYSKQIWVDRKHRLRLSVDTRPGQGTDILRGCRIQSVRKISKDLKIAVVIGEQSVAGAALRAALGEPAKPRHTPRPSDAFFGLEATAPNARGCKMEWTFRAVELSAGYDLLLDVHEKAGHACQREERADPGPSLALPQVGRTTPTSIRFVKSRLPQIGD